MIEVQPVISIQLGASEILNLANCRWRKIDSSAIQQQWTNRSTRERLQSKTNDTSVYTRLHPNYLSLWSQNVAMVDPDNSIISWLKRLNLIHYYCLLSVILYYSSAAVLMLFENQGTFWNESKMSLIQVPVFTFFHLAQFFWLAPLFFWCNSWKCYFKMYFRFWVSTWTFRFQLHRDVFEYSSSETQW